MSDTMRFAFLICFCLSIYNPNTAMGSEDSNSSKTEEITSSFLRKLASSQPDTRIRALHDICAANAEIIMPSKIWIEVLNATCDKEEGVRVAAWSVLETQGAAIAPVLRSVLLDKNACKPQIRPVAVQILSDVIPVQESSVPIFLNLIHDDSATIRHYAGLALSRCEPVLLAKLADWDIIIDRLSDDHTGVKTFVFNILRRQGSNIVPALVAKFKTEKTPLKIAIAKTLGAIGSEAIKCVTFLEGNIEELDPEAKVEVLKAIDRIKADLERHNQAGKK